MSQEGDTVVLYSMSGKRLAVLHKATMQVGYAAASLDPVVVDRWGRQMALHAGTVSFSPNVAKGPRPVAEVHGCAVMDAAQSRKLLNCDPQDESKPPRLRLRHGGNSTFLTGPAYPANQDGYYAGHWGPAFISPSGDWVFAQWSGECEVPSTYLINVSDLRRTPVGRDADGGVPETIALGWRPDNLAVAWAPTPACGSAFSKAGIYLIRPPGEVVTRIVTLPVRSGVSMWGG